MHRIAYEIFFRVTVADRTKLQGLDTNEDLLLIWGDQFLQKLLSLRNAVSKN